jgi:hypothetical protein
MMQMQGRENQRLKQQLQTQEDDRSFLVRQLVAVKKRNDDLRKRVASSQSELDVLRQELGPTADDPMSSLILEDAHSLSTESPSSPDKGLDHMPLPRQEADSRLRRACVRACVRGASPRRVRRYKDIIKRLSRMLDLERRHRKQVQTALDEFRASKMPLEMSLRECIEQIAREEGVAE